MYYVLGNKTLGIDNPFIACEMRTFANYDKIKSYAYKKAEKFAKSNNLQITEIINGFQVGNHQFVICQA